MARSCRIAIARGPREGEICGAPAKFRILVTNAREMPIGAFGPSCTRHTIGLRHRFGRRMRILVTRIRGA